MKKLGYLFFVLLHLLSLSCAKKEIKPSGVPYVLVSKYKEGRTYLYLTSMNIKNTMDMGGMSQTVNILSDTKYSFTVVRISGDTLFLRVKIEEINTRMKTPVGFKDIDEAGALRGKEVSFAILKDGRIIKKAKGKGKYANELANLMKGIGKMFSFLPTHPVRIHETWIDSTEEGVSQYTLKDVKIKKQDTIAIISAHFKVSTTKEEEQKGMKIKSTLKGEGDGTIKFSIKRGVLIYVSSNMGLEGEAHMEGGMAGGGMDIPIYIDQVSETKFLKEY